MLISSNRHEWVFQIVLWMNKLLLACFVSPRVNYIGKCFCLGNKAHIFLQISLRYFNLSQDHFIQRRAIFSSFILNIHEFLGITVPNWEFLLGGFKNRYLLLTCPCFILCLIENQTLFLVFILFQSCIWLDLLSMFGLVINLKNIFSILSWLQFNICIFTPHPNDFLMIWLVFAKFASFYLSTSTWFIA